MDRVRSTDWVVSRRDERDCEVEGLDGSESVCR
jgi:hypothetical protein